MVGPDDGWTCTGPGSWKLCQSREYVGMALRCRDGWNSYQLGLGSAHFINGPHPNLAVAMFEVVKRIGNVT